MASGTQPFDDELVELFDLAHDAFCVTGFDGYLKRVNPAYARILGYTQEELLARPWLDNFHSDDLPAVKAALAEVVAGNNVVGFECREVCADGSVRWFEWSTSSRPEAGIAYAVGRDITDRRKANDELSALRRVATLAVQGVAPADLFTVVAEEVARVVDVPFVGVARYDVDDTATVCASFPPESWISTDGKRWSLDGPDVISLVRDSSAPARVDDYSQIDSEIADHARRAGFRSTVGVPIVVAGRLWGAMVVSVSDPEPLPDDTAERLAGFTELLATAIADAESREALGRLASQQAALRRVATLVARGAAPAELFTAVADEMARCLHTGHAAIYRYADDALVPLAVFHGDGLQPLSKGFRLKLEANAVAARVLATGGAARVDRNDDAPVPHAGRVRGLGLHSAVGAPIIVEGRPWGVAVVGSLRPEQLPRNTEARMSDFADLVSTAIANAATRSELIASRARIVAAADEGRRRLERDLHDGAQQRLIALGLQTRLAEGSVPPGMPALKAQLGDIVSVLAGVSADLQEISRGIHPAILSNGGLGPALKTLARRSAIPVTLDLAIDRRLPDPVEVGAYYLVSEALTNAAKHSRASEVAVCGQIKDHTLSLSIHDDGIGGADAGKGSGLVGLKDRIEALGGRIRIMSPVGRGTSFDVTIPLDTP